MPQLLGLSYKVILPKRRRLLLANCLQEAECVNSQVTPCNAVPSGGYSHLVNSHFVNSNFVNIDQMGIDKVGIDKVGIDEVGS